MKHAMTIAALMAAGCTAVPAADGLPNSGSCNAAAAQGLVGQPASSALGAEALRLTGGSTIRWIQPGQAVTMDYRFDRVNIELDSQNRVTGITCG
jgi:hypothetical protein